MNILLINGSPKGKRSNSLRLANSFIKASKKDIRAKMKLYPLMKCM